jgi:hypothetical protein
MAPTDDGRERPSFGTEVFVVFDGPPGHESGRFVEAETPDAGVFAPGNGGRTSAATGCWVRSFLSSAKRG